MRHAALLPAATLALLAPAPLVAGTASGTMAVSLTVEEACNLDTRPMAFGTVANDNVRAEAVSELGVACTPAAAYTIGIDDGMQGANGRRRMAGAQAGSFVEYDIYRDAARTQRWGAGPASSVSGVIPASGSVVLPVYGRVLSGTAAADRYGDTVTVSVNF